MKLMSFLVALLSFPAFAAPVNVKCQSPEVYIIKDNAPYDSRQIIGPNGVQPAPQPASAPGIRASSTSGQGSCFAAGTKVLVSYLAGKPKYRSIQFIKPGDTVMAWDHYYNSFVAAKVSEVRQKRSTICRLSVDEGQTIKHILTTPDHPFFSPQDRGYMPISHLVKNDRLGAAILADGVSFKGKVFKGLDYVSEGVVYDLRVETYHNFFIDGEILVHNW